MKKTTYSLNQANQPPIYLKALESHWPSLQTSTTLKGNGFLTDTAWLNCHNWEQAFCMYRRSTTYQAQIVRQLEEKAAIEKRRMTESVTNLDPTLPNLRRVIEITDYDSGEAITHRIELFSCDRIDCYNALTNGKSWQTRIGWSRILADLRMALPRLKKIS